MSVDFWKKEMAKITDNEAIIDNKAIKDTSSTVADDNSSEFKPVIFSTPLTINQTNEVGYLLEFDEEQTPIITIKTVGKIINYTNRQDLNHKIQTQLQNAKNWLWVGKLGYWATEVKQVNVQFLTMKDTGGNQITFERDTMATVKFEFELGIVNSITQTDPSDHIIAVVRFTEPTLNNMEHPLGVSNLTGGKVAWVDVQYFTGFSGKVSQYGAVNTMHEIIAHLMGVGHQSKDKSAISYGGGVRYYSDKVTTHEAKTILFKISKGGLNRGDNFIVDRGLVLPNYIIKDDFGNKYSAGKGGAGVDLKSVIEIEKKYQGK